MLQIALVLLVGSICRFGLIMWHDPRTLWSGISLLWILLCLTLTLFFLVNTYADWMAEHDILMNVMVALLYLYLAVYLLSAMAVYLLSAALNLIHMKKCRGADYIIVLGARVIETRITPLLAARIDKGIELLENSPDAMLIMSGGQGPGEENAAALILGVVVIV